MKIKYIDLSNQNINIEENTQYIGLFIGKDREKLNSSIKFIHNKPCVTSNILIKAILFENSTIDIVGDIIINSGAYKTDAYLKIDVLLMSENASAKAIPSLEIFEDDVKGGHGASIGPVDPDQLFYIQARGINRPMA